MAPTKEVTVYIDWNVYQRMSYWAKLGGKKSREFTCFARTTIEEFQGGGYFFWISDAYLVKHEGNSAAVEIDEDDLAALMFKLDQQGVPPDEAFRCWVHSHPGTGPNATFLSGTDEENIHKFMEQGTDWLVSIVFDSRGEHPFTRVDFRSPMHHCLPGKLEILYPTLEEDEIKQLEEEFEQKSRAKTYAYSTGKYGKHGTPYYTKSGSYGGYNNYLDIGKGSSSSSKSSSGTTVVGFESKSSSEDKLGSSITGIYQADLDDEDFWHHVQMEYEDYSEKDSDMHVIGFEDAPSSGDMVIENGAIEMYVDTEDTDDGRDVFEECVENIALRISIGHITADNGIDSLTRMGYDKAKVVEALRAHLES
jgi:hypothetical protein